LQPPSSSCRYMSVALGAGLRCWSLIRNASSAHGLVRSRLRLAICLASSGSQSSEPALEWSNLPPVLRVRLPLVRYSYLGFPKTPERECTPQRTQNSTTADPNSDRRTDSVGQRCILIRRDDWLWLALAFCTVYEMCVS
jgi:hypothetical protein